MKFKAYKQFDNNYIHYKFKILHKKNYIMTLCIARI